LAIVNTLTQQSAAGTAAEAASWVSTYDLTNVHVWADTTDYFYTNFASQPAIGGGYPFTMVIDVDTMAITYFAGGQIASAASAIQTILDAEHTCTEY
jgi:hypothetical protein